MTALLAIAIAVSTGATNDAKGLFAGKTGDKLLVCTLRPQGSADAPTTARLAVFLPVYKKGDFGYKPGIEHIDVLSISLFDPSRVMKGLKANVLVDQPDKFVVVAGTVLEQEPAVLAVNPNAHVANGFTAVVGSQRGVMRWLGSCEAKTGSGSRAEFEALK